MSTKHFQAVFDAPLSAKQKLILMVLCYHSNDEGECYPSYKRITEKASVSQRTAQDAIAELEAMNILTREARPGCRNFFNINDPCFWVFEIDQNHGKECQGTPRQNALNLEETPAEFATHPSRICHPPRQPLPPTPAKSASNPGKSCTLYINTKKELLNNNERIKDKGKPPAYSPVADLIERGVDSETIADWMQLRSKKKAPVTKTVVTRHASEADKAGISLTEALQISCSRGWQGFEARFVVSATTRINPPPRSTSSRDRTANFMAKIFSSSNQSQGDDDAIDI
jgi:hypothetical protein